jgi:hypothetical protein
MTGGLLAGLEQWARLTRKLAAHGSSAVAAMPPCYRPLAARMRGWRCFVGEDL